MRDQPADGSSAPFGRPFLASSVGAVPASAAAGPGPGTDPSGDPEAQAQDTLIRPYFLTGGRVQAATAAAGFETIYVRGPEPVHPGHAYRTPEEEAILARCVEPLSVAELSSHLGLPIGVVLVLTGDLAASGALSARTADPDVRHDLSIITRLIHAVHAL